MSKIICDICGTSYPETEDRCPICGCAKGFTLEGGSEESVAEMVEETAAAPETEENKTVVFAPVPSNQDPVSAEDEDFDDDDEDYDDDEDDDDEDENEKSNAPLIVALILVILVLLAVSAFIFVKYFMPNVMESETTAPTAVTTTAAPTETTEVTVPCENLALTSGGEIVLDMEGANWLINVMALPENTTDKIVYTSSDETVVTVNEQGKVTAVGEGTAVITITCGTQTLECTVTVDYTPETSAPTEPEEETTAPTEPEETTEPTEPLKDITLKVLKYNELTFNAPGQGFKFVLDGLENNEVKWTSLDEKVVTVDENGFVISVGKGTTTIICQYGDQKVEIKITCRW